MNADERRRKRINRSDGRSTRSRSLRLSVFVCGSIWFSLFVAGCMTRPPAPVSDRTVQPKPAPGAKPPVSARAPGPADTRPAVYTVKPGDTLYSIALDYGL